MPRITVELFEDETVEDIQHVASLIARSIENLEGVQTKLIPSICEFFDGDIITALLEVRRVVGVYPTFEDYALQFTPNTKKAKHYWVIPYLGTGENKVIIIKK